MRKIAVFGNSGSGKSTLAMQLSEVEGVSHFDLDTIAWQPVIPPQRQPLEISEQAIGQFISDNHSWVIEGCYSDLLAMVLPHADEIIFLNLPIDRCIANAKKRPWEPHKYDSKAAQDANLEMLLGWIAQYEERDDTFSLASHQALFDAFTGKKTMYQSNEQVLSPVTA